MSQSYSRQNSIMDGADSATNANPPSQAMREVRNRASPLHVESVLGIQNDQPVEVPLVSNVQQSSPLSNSVRDGGGTGSGMNSPHTQSPLGNTLNPNVVPGLQDGRSPAAGRPDFLGYHARSPSFRGENQPSPLTEDGKTVSYARNNNRSIL